MSPGRWFVERVLAFEGSTRAMALLRIGLVLTMWARLAESVRPFDDLRPSRLVLSAAFFLLTPLLLAGVGTRVVAPLNALLLVVLYFGFGLGNFGLPEVEPWSHHHIYAMVVQGVLLALTPCGRSLSVDRWWAVRRAQCAGEAIPPERGPLWATRLMVLQVVAMYAWTAWDKTFPGFLLGDRMGMMAAELYFAGDLPDVPGLDLLFTAMGSATLAIEWLLPVALLFRRTHRWSIPLGLLLHGIIFISLPVGTFSATMWLFYLAFLPPDAVHDALERVMGRPPPPDASDAPDAPAQA
jgi:hypothetical protein